MITGSEGEGGDVTYIEGTLEDRIDVVGEGGQAQGGELAICDGELPQRVVERRDGVCGGRVTRRRANYPGSVDGLEGLGTDLDLSGDGAIGDVIVPAGGGGEIGLGTRVGGILAFAEATADDEASIAIGFGVTEQARSRRRKCPESSL